MRRALAALHPLFFMSGAAALAYEVLWMRRFALLLGATAPAAAAALVAFFAGLGLGSYLLGRFAPRLTRPLRAFAILEVITGVSALAVDPILRAMQRVLGQGLRLVAVGGLLGLAGALGAARLMTGFLYETSPWDVGTYLGTGACSSWPP